MKLNAKMESERASRIVSKSGDEMIKIHLHHKNTHVATLEYNSIGDNKCILLIHQWDRDIKIVKT